MITVNVNVPVVWIIPVVWFVGLFLVPRVVSFAEAGYGLVTVGSLFIWTFIMLVLEIVLR